MKKRNKIILGLLTLLIIILCLFGIYYVNDYYHADDNIKAYLSGNENVSVKETSNGILLDGKGNENAIIFYPGAKVEYTSYIPLFMNLSNEGVDCFIVEMPFNLAIFGPDSADSIMQNNSYNYSNWYMSGHSMGGVIAASYAHYNPEKIDGIILLASYPSNDIKNISTLSIYGSNDNVLNKKNYDKNKKFLPDNATEHVIKGGNHAQFAYYGNQSGDGVADITRDKQIKESVEEILNFINSSS